MQSSHRKSLETVELTVGIHRQTWISGYPLFVDVRIVNRGKKAVRKVELLLERSTFIYAHTAPVDEEGLRASLRMPDSRGKDILVKAICPGWLISGRSHDLRTCRLQIPSGLVSVDEGKFFGVRFFLTIRIALSFVHVAISRGFYRTCLFASSKYLSVQLPITIIHPNSIDIPPNCLAQVAATIEHKHRSRSPSSPDILYKYRPGQAFIAARRQSFDEVARRTVPREEVNEITTILDSSTNSRSQQPRRRASTSVISAPGNHPNPDPRIVPYRSSRFVEGTNSFRKPPPPMRTPPRPPQLFDTFVIGGGPSSSLDPSSIPDRRKPHRASMDEQSTGSHRPEHHQSHVIQHRRTRSSLTEKEKGNRGPRLQRSTSGLGFESSEDEVDGDLFVDETTSRARLKRRVKTESQRPLRGDF
ncbi:MAG: hypothetical protein Q9202_003091 [Teloschistes flavicans]